MLRLDVNSRILRLIHIEIRHQEVAGAAKVTRKTVIFLSQ